MGKPYNPDQSPKLISVQLSPLQVWLLMQTSDYLLGENVGSCFQKEILESSDTLRSALEIQSPDWESPNWYCPEE